jgi:hypothetical protein
VVEAVVLPVVGAEDEMAVVEVEEVVVEEAAVEVSSKDFILYLLKKYNCP